MLPVSKLDVINQAMIEIGRLPVTNENDSDASQLISAKIDLLLPLMLLETTWNFAVKYISDSTPNTQQFSPEYLYTYQLPFDYGRLFRFQTNCWPLTYMITDGLLLTDILPIQYYYIVNSIDFDAFNALFYRALSLYTASDSCLVLTNNEQLTQYLAQKYEKAKSDAMLFNDMERDVRTVPYNDYDRTVWF